MADDGLGAGLEGRTITEQVRHERKAEEGKRDQKPDAADSALKEWAGLLIRAGVWAILIYQFIFQVSVVRGQSMQPNFHEGDKLLIDKLTYRFSNPRPGDVVVFEAMVKERNGRYVHRDYIKRVIAGPDSVVKIYGGVEIKMDAPLQSNAD